MYAAVMVVMVRRRPSFPIGVLADQVVDSGVPPNSSHVGHFASCHGEVTCSSQNQHFSRTLSPLELAMGQVERFARFC